MNFAGRIILAEREGDRLVFDTNGVNKENFDFSSVMPTESKSYYITIGNNGEYGIVDNNLSVLVENKYSYLEYAFERYFIESREGKFGIIEDSGRQVIDNKYDSIQKVTGANILQTMDSSSNMSEIYNMKMEKIAEMQDPHIHVKDGYVKITSTDDLIYLDMDGNIKEAKDVIPENTVFARKVDGKWGYVDRQGKTIIDFKFDMATDVNEFGYGAIKLENKWAVIDANGNQITDFVYELPTIEPTFIKEFYKESADYEIDIFSKTI